MAVPAAFRARCPADRQADRRYARIAPVAGPQAADIRGVSRSLADRSRASQLVSGSSQPWGISQSINEFSCVDATQERSKLSTDSHARRQSSGRPPSTEITEPVVKGSSGADGGGDFFGLREAAERGWLSLTISPTFIEPLDEFGIDKTR